MRPRTRMFRHRKVAATIAVGMLVASLTIVPGTALAAAITPATNDATGATALASAMVANTATLSAASFAEHPPAETPLPNGTSDALSFFPTNGTTFGILTTGDVNLADDANELTNSGANLGGGNVRGTSDFDVTILKVDLTVPAEANCLLLDFAFYSEEFPEFVGSSFNDAFIAELDTSDWTTSGSTITAPNNFAFDSTGDVVSINSTGVGGMSLANAAGTTYDGATVLLQAATPVPVIEGGAHSLYLSIFDQGDQAYDSAAFIDNIRLITVANAATDCVKGATPVTTAHLTLAKSVTGGGTAVATDWTLSAIGPITISGQTGDAEITDAEVNAGTYTLAESGPEGYTAGDWSCTGGTLEGSSLDLAPGETASCSITNTFIPPAHLTLTKSVAGGGTALATDWTLSATGPTTISGSTGDATITNAEVSAGTYTLAESGPEGYTPGAWSCDGVTLDGSSLTLDAGETASCSITNTFPFPAGQPSYPCPETGECVQVASGSGTAVTLSAATGTFSDVRFEAFVPGQLCGDGGPTDLNGVLNFKYDGDDPKTIVFALSASLVTKNIEQYKVCWQSNEPFKMLGGKPAPQVGGLFTGYLPNCTKKNAAGPCVLFRKTNKQGQGFIGILAPDWDPKTYPK